MRSSSRDILVIDVRVMKLETIIELASMLVIIIDKEITKIKSSLLTL